MAERHTISHKELVRRAARWLSGTRGCAVVMTERTVAAANEQPDAIGWKGYGPSILVECKSTRADFLADRAKIFRRMEDLGVGDERYFAAPLGLLSPDDLPDGWGLLEVGKHHVRVTREAQNKRANKAAEVSMLVAAIRRLELAGTVFVRHGGEPEQDQEVTDG